MKLCTSARRAFLAGLAAAACLCGSASIRSDAASPDRTIEVAIDLPFSGVSADTVTSEARAFELAIRQVDAAGLPGGFHLQPIRFDHGVPGKIFDPARAEQNAADNIADPRILAVFGTQNSGAAKVVIPRLNAAGLAMISATNTNPALTQAALRPDHPELVTYFRVCGTDDLQGAAGAQLVEQLGYKNVYVLDNGDTFGQGLAESFASAFTRAGTVIAYDKGVSRGQYAETIQKIIDRRPEAVYFGADAQELGTFRRQMKDAGIGQIPFFSGDGMNLDGYTERAGAAVYRSFYTVMSPNGLHLTNPIAKRFARDFRAGYNRAPQPFDAAAYSSGQIVGAAIREALRASNGRMPTREQVRREIAQTRNLETALGPVTFNADGNTRVPYVSYYTFTLDGNLKFLKQFTMEAGH